MGLLSCINTVPIPIPEALHSTSKALVKFGNDKNIIIIKEQYFSSIRNLNPFNTK
jgi:hypothetical protein